MTTTTRVDTYEWMRLVRRIRLTSPTKLIALTLATYANQDGTRIFPGVRRLTAVTGLSERSVRGAMKTLRDVGLIERTRVGSSMGRRALTDEHELAFPADLVQRLAAHRIGLLGPDESPAPDAGDEVYAQERTTCEQAGGNRSTPSSSPAGGAADDFGSPAPPAGSPAPPAPHLLSYQPPTNPLPTENSRT